jgi:uridine kinase
MILCLNLYVDADVRLARRIRRDTVERGRDIHSVLEQARIIFFLL